MPHFASIESGIAVYADSDLSATTAMCMTHLLDQMLFQRRNVMLGAITQSHYYKHVGLRSVILPAGRGVDPTNTASGKDGAQRDAGP